MLFSIVVAGLFGAFVGSFLNVCVHRLPRNESVVTPASRCYACGAAVRWHDNLPILGWLILKGRCRFCGSPFSIRYLLIEALVGLLSAAAVWAVQSGALPPAPWLTAAGLAPWMAQVVAGTGLLLLVWFLVVATLIDLDHYIIPDELTKSFQLIAPFAAMLLDANRLFAWDSDGWMVSRSVFGELRVDGLGYLAKVGGMAGAACALLLLSLPVARYIYSTYCPESERWRSEDHLGFRWGVLWFVLVTVVQIGVLALLCWRAGRDHLVAAEAAVSLGQALMGSLVGWGSLYLVGLIGTIAFRRNAMGFGDVKFLAPIGAWLGPIGVVFAFFGAAVAGSLIGIPMLFLGGKRVIPFGPYLAVGTILALAVGPAACRALLAPLMH